MACLQSCPSMSISASGLHRQPQCCRPGRQPHSRTAASTRHFQVQGQGNTPAWPLATCMQPARLRCSRHRTRASNSGGGLGDEQGVDVAVFRFTLGIPGFEDRMIPRVVGAFGAALLAINHVFGAQPAPDSQVRAEFLILGLAVLCVLVPEIEERLREALPGRGRQSMAESIAGATNGFALAPGLADSAKQELAWSSASLLKNTNSCGVVVVARGRVVMARGALASGVYNPKAVQQTLDAMSKDLAGLADRPELAAALASAPSTAADTATNVEAAVQQNQVYLPDRSAMGSAQVAGCACIPQGAQSLLFQGLSGSPQPSYMLLYSERPRALSDKERRWAAAMATKLAPLVT